MNETAHEPAAALMRTAPTQIPLADWQAMLSEPGWFLVAEASVNDDVMMFAEAQDTPDKNRLFWGAMGEQNAALSPHLLRPESFEWFEEYIATQPPWGMAVRLDPSLLSQPPAQQLEMVLRHLRAWTLVDYPQEGTIILRISDWEIFTTLWQASGELSRHQLRGPLGAVAYWQPGAETVDYLAFETPPDIVQASTIELPLVLTAPQDKALTIRTEQQRYRQYQQHLQTHHGEETADWDEARFDDYLYTHLSQAKSHGFGDRVEQLKYLTLTIAVGEDFITRPWAQEILRENQVKGLKDRIDRLVERGLKALGEAHDEESDVV
ncbi:hypothetical protein VA7868_02628 [Vibrio aerogenes CECT 7868]|uniref:DUF4123 domain-containing protein n=1 Tax=Vibrio aerogenes CECT 7868 TaxID=1216006 RepID=A0A1M5ZEK5_9VIBR|nr:DUF4123 domain-containing protein [Vibrio aerogenes]SHI22648.1 hypothetical protein VA7868_02628 [Vibrio aerogenes CECT 7868]